VLESKWSKNREKDFKVVQESECDSLYERFRQILITVYIWIQAEVSRSTLDKIVQTQNALKLCAFI